MLAVAGRSLATTGAQLPSDVVRFRTVSDPVPVKVKAKPILL